MANITWAIAPECHDEDCEMFGTPLNYRGRRSVDCWCWERSDAYVEWLAAGASSRNAPPEAPAPGAGRP